MRIIASLALALTLTACNADKDASEAKLQQLQQQELAAEKAAAKSAAEARAAEARVTKLEAELDALEKNASAVVALVSAAQTDADRSAAAAKLKELQSQQADLQTQLATSKADAAKAARMKGVRIPKECLDNPLAAGCN